MLEGRQEQYRRSPPYGILLAIVIVIVVLAQGETITEATSEVLTPMGLLLLPILLLLIIQFLSSDCGSFISAIFLSGDPNTIHRVSGSPVGVALFLVFFLFLVSNRVSLFGGEDGA